MSSGVLTELRKLRPNRRLSLDESLRVAEQQANRLLRICDLTDVSDAPVPEDLISGLPRFLVRRYPLGASVSGLAHWDRGRWCIALNSREPIVRQRFSLAHELGHVVESPFDRHADPRLVERIADHFAASLLMPRSWVKEAWGHGVQDSAQLAETFFVSEVAMTRRLHDLRLDEPDDLGRAFGRHGRRYLRRNPSFAGSMS